VFGNPREKFPWGLDEIPASKYSSMMTTITEQIREAVELACERGWSINRLAQAADVSRGSLQDWYSGAQDSISLETAQGLCEFFEMRLTPPRIKSPERKHP
jgi:transposase-like protein